MHKYNKLQATLKALAHPSIGIDSITKIKFIVDVGAMYEFDSKNIRNDNHNKYATYEKLKNIGMFTEVSGHSKTKLAVHQLSDKGQDIYNTILDSGRP